MAITIYCNVCEHAFYSPEQFCKLREVNGKTFGICDCGSEVDLTAFIRTWTSIQSLKNKR